MVLTDKLTPQLKLDLIIHEDLLQHNVLSPYSREHTEGIKDGICLLNEISREELGRLNVIYQNSKMANFK